MRRAKRLATTLTVIDKKKAPEGLGAPVFSKSIMAEITNEIDWLKACNHLVFENYADADAWG